MDQEYHSELFDIRRVVEGDKELFRDVAAAEYIFGRVYKIEPEIGIKIYTSDAKAGLIILTSSMLWVVWNKTKMKVPKNSNSKISIKRNI